MDINIQWVSPTGTLAVDYFNVLYKEFDLYPPVNGLNDWILATDPPLPNNQFNYTITGLKENTIYRIMVTKACTGVTEVVDEITFIRTGYPIIGTWQGPVVNTYPTLFYSVYYPEGPHIASAGVKLYDTQTYDVMLQQCGAPDPAYVVVGRNGYLTGAICPPVGNSTNYLCDLQSLDYLLPSNTSSAVSYLGRDNSAAFFPTCDGTGAQPLLLKYNNDYKLYSQAYPRFASNYSSIDPTSAESAVNWPAFTFVSDPTQPYPNLNTANISNIGSVLCFDNLTGTVNYTFADGTGRTNINNYLFSFVTSDGVNSLPLLDNAGNPITSHNGSYNIYAPIKIQSAAPGGGNSNGYTITGASSSGGNTTYTYNGGPNAFTVGQDVFVTNVNPASFNFTTTSITISAATSNSFTVSFTATGTYQTGGLASGYTELTNNMTITVDLQPAQNVITLTNQNYLGLTLIQALNQIAGAINTASIYTASAVVVGGYPYLKINVPDITYASASVIFEGPNILTKGGPDILQTSSAAAAPSSINYNGFLYTSFSETANSKIVASDINNPTVATNYSHPIDIPISEIVLVPEVPPATVYSLDRLSSGGNYSLNVAVDTSTGYSYIADNTTVSVYDGTLLIDSQDLSLLPGGPTTPIRLMEFNTTDSTLYVFVDGASNNFYIMVGYGAWVINSVGTYSQTNYIQRSSITAWNNTTAVGSVTTVPTQPIPCATIPCPNPNPALVANNANDGVNSALFQDSTKTWNVVPPSSSSFPEDLYYVYNSTRGLLGAMFYYYAPAPTIYQAPGISGNTVRIGTALTNSGTKTPFLVQNGDNYGIFHRVNISDYTSGNFNSRTWANTTKYLIESGRNANSNGYLTSGALNHTNTTFNIDSYNRGITPRDNRTNSTIGLDPTSNYLLYDITDGGTAYESSSNYVYVSLNNGIVQMIDNTGLVISTQLYKDYPLNTIPVEVPLQLVADNASGFVYGIARDARSAIDDMNVYILQGYVQYGVIDGSTKWNTPISGQIAVDESTGMIYFTGKNTRKFITVQYPSSTGPLWGQADVPSVYEKLNGFTYGNGSIIERIQGASFIGNMKFVIMNYLQQTYSTELKYTYEVANLFVYDFNTQTVEQVLIGTGVNTYSGAPGSYNPNFYGESFGINNYNNDYCYGGLGVKTNPNNGQIFWKKSVVDQVYFSEAHNETGVAQIWGNGAGSTTCSKLMRIWNIQSDGSLIPSKRTILDNYSSFYNMLYDSYYEGLITGVSGIGYQFYIINPKTLGGVHGVNTISQIGKNGQNAFISGLTPSLFPNGKQSYVYGAVASPTEIVYSVRPYGAAINGIFPHHYAVGDIVRIAGIVSTPINQLDFVNATITAVTPTTFTIANTTSTSATFSTGGLVTLSTYANMSANGLKFTNDNAGNVYCWGDASGSGYPANSNVILKFNYNDLYTQRESPDIINIGTVSIPCSATPDGIFVVGSFTTMMNNSFIHIPSQNTFWLLGRKNPTCTTSNITNAVYNAGTQTVRYYINNNFLVGKVVTISGVLPNTYNLFNVTITAVDPTWIEISYTGAAPAPFDPLTPATSKVELSPSYIIKVLNDTTFATVATIDLSFINDFVGSLINTNGRFQYSPAEEKMYLYSGAPDKALYAFSTITNTLVQSNSLNRMVLPYNKLTTIYTMQDVNGIPYFNAYTSTDTPTKRWFRLTAGSRVYLNDVHNELDVTVSDAIGSTTFNYDIYSLTTSPATTFGQWKDILDTTWDTIPTTITTTLNSTIEFVSFKMDSPILSIENNTTGYLYPVSNTLNYVPVYSILIDNVNIQNADALNFTFANPENPSCPFTRQVTIYF
jgi:hypothetical protein